MKVDFRKYKPKLRKLKLDPQKLKHSIKLQKFDFRKHKKAVAVITLAAILVVGGGTLLLRSRSGAGEPVNVYPFHYIGMTEYWGDAQESYGPVNSDRVQTVFLSESQTITEIKVAEGDTVKKGDLLMTYDTTLSDISVERKRLLVERLKLQLQNEQARLQEINAMVPMDPSAETPNTPDYGPQITVPYSISLDTKYDGKTPETALVCHVRDDTNIDNTLLAALYTAAVVYQTENLAAAPTPEITPAPEVTPVPEVTPEPAPEGPAEVTNFYAIIKGTAGNALSGPCNLWQGMHISLAAGSTYVFKFFDASHIPDHTIATEDGSNPDGPSSDIGYTAAEIAQMRAEQQRTINELNVEIKMAESEYKLAKLEADNGSIYAEIDGQVVSLLSEEQARMEGQPLMKVSGGGGFFVDGSISELELHNMKIGQEVEVNDWNTGMTYIGTIESIGNFPDGENGWNGMGNPNASYFPFRVYIDGSADLQTGQYVSVMYSASAAENGIYLENPFLRTEQGNSYVYVMGENGRLEKRTVTTGKNLWGSYTEIRGGLSPDDLIAFPYGKNVREGAKAVEADISALYE